MNVYKNAHLVAAWLLITVIAVVVPGCSEAAEPLDVEDFRIVDTETERGVELFGPMASVFESFGEPLVIQEKKRENNDRYLWFVYDGLVVGTWESSDLAQLLIISSPQYATGRGISVGDSRDRTIEHYGIDADMGEDWIQYSIAAPDTQPPRQGIRYSYLMTFILDGADQVITEIYMNRATQ